MIKSMGMLDLIVALGEEMGLELFVGQDTCLRQTIHAVVDIHHDIAIDFNGGEVVVGYNDIGYKGYLNMYVFKFLHGGGVLT